MASPRSFLNISNLRIAQKLPLVMVAGVLVSILTIGISSYLQSASALRENAASKLTALMEVRRAALSDYLETIRQDLRFQSTNPVVLDALEAFSAGWQEIGSDPTVTLQRLYITNNPHPTGEKEKFDAAPDGSTYSFVHSKYHPWFRTFLRERGYYDIFLFDLDGNLIYTVFKELDYATNLNRGQWKDSDLGNAFRAARDNPKSGSHTFFDFKPYAPSHGAPASFISTQILDTTGRAIGVLVFQMPIDNLNAVMQNTAGLGETGESFIVGDDALMRNDSRFSENSTILERKVDSEPIALALSGQSGVTTVDNFRGQNALTAYGPLDFLGTRWALLAEIETDEIFASVITMRNMSILFGAAILIVLAVVGLLFARTIARPIMAMTAAMRTLAGGDNSIGVPALGRGDEIGEMAGALQTFKETSIEAERLTAEKEREQAQIAARAKHVNDLSRAFETNVAGLLDEVAKASTEMRGTAESMSGTAEQTTDRAAAVASASEEASTTVQTVASAAEELSGSISEISRQVSQSTDIATKAVEEAGKVNDTVQTLAEAAQKIGDVISLINDIAGQTNLLALNATIEAARAGEAGKGFAVVASEVKNLASQTAKATEEIATQIGGMQTVTTDTVAAIGDVRSIIDQISENTTAIASAVEEQNAATQEISRNVQQVSAGTTEVSSNIAGVSQAASDTGNASAQVLDASDKVSQQSEQLKNEVQKFLRGLKAA